MFPANKFQARQNTIRHHYGGHQSSSSCFQKLDALSLLSDFMVFSIPVDENSNIIRFRPEPTVSNCPILPFSQDRKGVIHATARTLQFSPPPSAASLQISKSQGRTLHTFAKLRFHSINSQ